MSEPLRYAAFTDSPEGGNPAGVVLDATGMTDADMLAVAAELGYSETAFAIARGRNEYELRYFSPLAEVPFCGHATIAAAVALAEREGDATLLFHTRNGDVPVQTRAGTATLTSVVPYVEPAPEALVRGALDALRWRADELDPALPPRIGYAGVRHLILGAATRARLADLDYDFDALQRIMLEHDLTTVDLVFRADPTTYHARNPFPVGGVVEDPATGAAAAAFGAYLRHEGLIAPPATITVHQGDDMGRPSVLEVEIGERPEIRVSGRAVSMTADRPPARA